MQLKQRIKRMEKVAIESQVESLINNVERISDTRLTQLWEVSMKEREKRGLIQKPEIEAAQALYENLIQEGESKESALSLAVDAAKSNGFKLTHDQVAGG